MKRIILLVMATLLMVACQSTGSKKEKEVKTLTKKELLQKIAKTEKALFSDSLASGIDKKSALALASDYQSFASRFPNDSLAPGYLFKASDILMNMNRPQQTIFIFNKIINKYPDFNKLPTCYFLRAFVYDDQLKDYKAAKKYYNEFLSKYPDSDFADDAKMLLNNLGKSPEELIKEFGGK